MDLTARQKIMLLLFKDFTTSYNSRNLSKIIGLSHAGAFKIMKKLEAKNIVSPKKIGKAVIYSINLNNPLADKEIELALIIEAQNYKKWLEEFKELNKKSDFIILFGSILKNEKYAKDIDLLVVANKFNSKEIKGLIAQKNKILNKKLHPILQTLNDFKKDISNKNKVLLEIIKTGVVLFGQDKLVKELK